MINLSAFGYEEKLKSPGKAFAKTFSNNSFINGPAVKEFETAFAEFTGAKDCVAVSSCTSALQLSLLALSIGPGDEVITVPYTWVSTVEAIKQVGATPIFVDINATDLCIDVGQIRNVITERTKAILPVDLYGTVSNIDALKKFNLPIVQDAAQSTGAIYKGKRVGGLSHLTCFSFYPTKNLGTFGDAGIVSTNKNKIYKKLKLLREYGWVKKNISLQNGSNKRLDELHAGILNIKLAYLDQFNNKRILIAHKYLKFIKSKKIILPEISSFKKHVFHLFVVRVKNKKRNNFLNYLKKNNIYAGIHYPIPNHLQKPFLKYHNTKLPITEEISKEIVSIPNYPLLSNKQISKIIDVINKF